MSDADQGRYKDIAMQTARFTANPSTGINNLIYTGKGYLDSITLSQEDAAPTAGFLGVYDSVSSYGTDATTIFKHGQTTAVFQPVTVKIGQEFSTGLTLGITTMADVGVRVHYKTEH